MPRQFLLLLSFILFFLSPLASARDVRSLTSGQSSHLSGKPVTTRKLTQAKVLWANLDLLRVLGVDMPADLPKEGLTPEFEKRLLETFAYSVPRELDQPDTFDSEEKIMSLFHGSGYVGDVAIEGIAPSSEIGIEQSVREAIWGETPVLALIDTGTHTVWQKNHEYNLSPRILIVRPLESHPVQARVSVHPEKAPSQERLNNLAREYKATGDRKIIWNELSSITYLNGHHREPAAVASNDWTEVEIREANGIREVWGKRMGQPDALLGTLETLQPHTPLYHWGPVKEVARLLGQGKVDQGEVDFLRQGSGVSGGGFYVSLNSLDSSGFGVWAVTADPAQAITLMKRTHTVPIPNWNNLNQLLSQKNIQGIWQTTTWINLLDSAPLQSLRTPTLKEILDNPSYATNFRGSIFTIDSEAPLDLSNPEGLGPDIQKIMTGNLSEDDVINLAQRLQTAKLAVPSYDTPLSRKFFSQASEVVRAKFSGFTPWDDLAARMTGTPDPHIRWTQIATFLGIQPSALLPNASLSDIDFESLAKMNVFGLTGFADDLATAAEFIDSEDLLVAIAHGDSAPWKRYDEPGKAPLLDRWRQATSIQGPFQGATRDQDRLVRIFRTMSGESDGYFRKRPVEAGGDVYVGNKGYYRVTGHEKEMLEANPFLSTEVIADPADTAGGGFLARHEYPSARTFKRFKQFLSSDLVTKLESADSTGLLATDSEDAQKFTQQIIEELTLKAYTISDPLLQYQTLISIHPFTDYNGRSLRAHYKTKAGMPLFLWDDDLDIFLSPYEFNLEEKAGRSALIRFKSALLAEQARGGYPKYYDLPELWMLGTRTDGHPLDINKFITEMRKFYSRGDTMDKIRQKQFQEVFADLLMCDLNLSKPLHR